MSEENIKAVEKLLLRYGWTPAGSTRPGIVAIRPGQWVQSKARKRYRIIGWACTIGPRTTNIYSDRFAAGNTAASFEPCQTSDLAGIEQILREIGAPWDQ